MGGPGFILSILIIGTYSELCLSVTPTPPVIPAYLYPCYQNQSIYHRENRYPQTLKSLLDLIRKLENSPQSRTLDARQLASRIFYYVKLDGIVPSSTGPTLPSNVESNIIPFAPREQEYYRYRVTVSELIPPSSTDASFINNTLSIRDLCNLHFMISNSIETQRRDNEQCPQTSNRRTDSSQTSWIGSGRFRRSLDSKEEDVVTITDDVPGTRGSDEKLNNSKLTLNGEPLFSPSGPSSRRQYPQGSIKYSNTQEGSQCPIENGVIQTPFGTVAPGTILAGIAAGLNNVNSIPASNLGVTTGDQAGIKINPIWASTLSGVLSDMLLNVDEKEVNSAIGVKGGWNSTSVPKWYFLQDNNGNYVTEAEMNGALDGLFLGLLLNKNLNVFNSNFKLSQIFEMFYASFDAMGTNNRACKRGPQYPYGATENEIDQQIEGFTAVMNVQSLSQYTVIGVQPLAVEGANAVSSYVKTLGDQCGSYSSLVRDDNQPVDFFTNVVVVVDGNWPDNSLADIFSILVNNDVIAAAYQSNTTLICGSPSYPVLFQGTDSISFLNNITSLNCTGQMDLKQSVIRAGAVFRQIYSYEQKRNLAQKGSMVALFMPSSSSNVINTDIASDIANFRVQLPDVKILVATNGPKEQFKALVENPDSDIFVVSPPSNSDTETTSLTQISTTIKSLPLRLANPACGYDYIATGSSGKMSTNIRLGSIQYYKVLANSFSRVGDSATIRVRTTSSGSSNSLTVCWSRTNPQPRGTVTDVQSNSNYRKNARQQSVTSQTSDATCQTANQDIKLTNPCNGYNRIKNCPPLYISVYAPLPAAMPQFNCKTDCQYPSNIPFDIEVNQLSCDSSATWLVTNSIVVVVALLARFLL